MSTTDQRVELGEEFAGYRVERLLGSGSFGSVYLAEELNPQLQRKVALKVLHPDLAADAAFRERFFRESRLVGRLEAHPAIVSVYNAGETDGTLWIASRYIEGTDLRTLLEQRGRLDARHAARLVDSIARALDTAHREGIVHRDVKPGNILLSDDIQHGFLADFGLSKKMTVGVDDSLTRVGQFVGTVKYAAPEQLRGGEVTGSADQYSLGCVLFEMITGRAPFDGGIEAVLLAHVNDPIPDVVAFVPDLPGALTTVLRQATAKLPHDRYATCTEFSAAVSRELEPDVPATLVGAPTGTSQQTSAPPTLIGPAAAAAPMAGSQTPVGQPPFPEVSKPAPPKRSAWIAPVTIGVALLLALTGVLVGVRVLGQSPFPDGEEEALLELVPSTFRDTCERDTGQRRADGVLAALACEPPEGAAIVTFRQLDTRQDLARHFTDELEGTPVVDDEDTDCVDFTDARSEYETADLVSGEVACYRDGGRSYLVWTADELRLIGTARADDRRDRALFVWWSEQFDVTSPQPAEEEQSDQPSAVDALLGLVPPAMAGGCSPEDLGLPGELAGLSCATPEGAEAGGVSYVLFDSAASTRSGYDAVIEAIGLARNVDGRCPAEQPWTQDDVDVPGRFACGFDEDGDVVVVWSDEQIGFLASAFRIGSDTEALLAWWERNDGGPVR